MPLHFASTIPRVTSLLFAESVGSIWVPAGNDAIGAAAALAAMLALAVAVLYRASRRRALGRFQQAIDNYARREIARDVGRPARPATDDTETGWAPASDPTADGWETLLFLLREVDNDDTDLDLGDRQESGAAPRAGGANAELR